MYFSCTEQLKKSVCWGLPLQKKSLPSYLPTLVKVVSVVTLGTEVTVMAVKTVVTVGKVVTVVI